jgi:acetyl esterase/lipase
MKTTTLPSSVEEFAPYVETLAAQTEVLFSLPREQMRAAFNLPTEPPSNTPKPGEDFETTHQKIPVRDGSEIEVRIYRNLKVKGNGKSLLVVRFHGGGWQLGGLNTEDTDNRFLMNIPNVVVVSVDYRLAPEFKFPIPVHDCFDALLWCKANASTLGIDAEKIIVAGSSAGGNLSTVVALMASFSETKTSGIIGQILNYPVTCHLQHYPSGKYKLSSMEENANAPMLGKDAMASMWNEYVTLEEGKDILASPLLASKDVLSKAPKTRIVACGGDPLHDEAVAYAQALDEAGVDVELDEYPGLPHGFNFESKLPSVESFYRRQVEFVERVIAEN